MVKYGCLFYMLEMLIARHLGTPNSVFLLAMLAQTNGMQL